MFQRSVFSAEVHSFDINQEPILETVKNRQNDSKNKEDAFDS